MARKFRDFLKEELKKTEIKAEFDALEPEPTMTKGEVMIGTNCMDLEHLSEEQRKKIPREIDVEYCDADFISGEKLAVPMGWTCPECGTYTKLIGSPLTPGTVCLSCGQKLLITENTFETKIIK